MPATRIKTTLGLACLLFCFSCAHRQALKPVPAEQSPASRATGAAHGPKGAGHSYIVRRGDNLWAIAARRTVLGDPFKWPLLYRLNRDEIRDPDLIYPRQDLIYRTAIDSQLLNQVIQEAKDTPAFVHHSSPRKVLPMVY